MKNAFEIYYNTGGGGGPHMGLEAAETAARNRIAGDSSGKLTSVEIRPYRDATTVGGYAPNNKESVYIEKVTWQKETVGIKKRTFLS